MVEVRFLDDMRRRTSIIHYPTCDLQQEAGPQTQGEVLEMLYVSGPRMELTHKMIADLATMVDTIQSKVAQAERSMATQNPPVFAAAQVGGTLGSVG